MNSTTGVTEASVTTAATGSFSASSNTRLGQLLQVVIEHLHGIVRDGNVTAEEWRSALAFLVECARFTSDERNEFTLLSDILGVSSLVDLRAGAGAGTPGSLLGPFYRPDSKIFNGFADLVRGQAGMPTLFRGEITDLEGRPIPGAILDFWQNADNGLYPAMDPGQDPGNLRCKLVCDTQGRFEIKAVRPRPYSVPTDGPVGTLLDLVGKKTMRPAHWHIFVQAPGYRSLVTELFPSDDPFLGTDPVFSIRPGLVVPFVLIDDPLQADRLGIACPFSLVEYAFRLNPDDQASCDS